MSIEGSSLVGSKRRKKRQVSYPPCRSLHPEDSWPAMLSPPPYSIESSSCQRLTEKHRDIVSDESRNGVMHRSTPLDLKCVIRRIKVIIEGRVNCHLNTWMAETPSPLVFTSSKMSKLWRQNRNLGWKSIPKIRQLLTVEEFHQKRRPLHPLLPLLSLLFLSLFIFTAVHRNPSTSYLWHLHRTPKSTSAKGTRFPLQRGDEETGGQLTGHCYSHLT